MTALVHQLGKVLRGRMHRLQQCHTHLVAHSIESRHGDVYAIDHRQHAIQFAQIGDEEKTVANFEFGVDRKNADNGKRIGVAFLFHGSKPPAKSTAESVALTKGTVHKNRKTQTILESSYTRNTRLPSEGAAL